MLVQRIGEKVRPPGPLLEIGTGTGGLASTMVGTGWSVEGLEPSKRLCEASQQLLGPGTSVHCRRFEEADPVLTLKPYRAVVAIDVLEHIPDPTLLPRRAFGWLADKGYLILQTPNARGLRRRIERGAWEQLAQDRHFLIHSRESLLRVLQGCGFTRIAIGTVSGTPVDGPFKRFIMRFVGGCLALLDLGNALWAVAKKEQP